MTGRMQLITRLMILSTVLGGLVGCASPATQPAIPPTPTVAPGWERFSASTGQGQCGYTIDYPSGMDITSQGGYSWTISHAWTEPTGPFPNFIYVSLIPDGFQSNDSGAIYNYDPAHTQTLLNMQVGEGKALIDDPNLGPWFSYTRLADTRLAGQNARTYENTQPWEFPPGTKEIRYYIQANGCTYLAGGYMSTVGSGQPGAIDQESFDQIMATFRLAP